jgi:hypothetical protein
VAATATKDAKGADTGELLALLAIEGEQRLADVLAKTSDAAVAVAWARGEVEFGKTKYVVTGNPHTAVQTHNGVNLPPPTVVIEGGHEWTGPKKLWHQSFAKLREEKLPACPRYQKYQLEVCVNPDRDVWEWLEEGQSPGRRETRYARRDVDRAEAERLFDLRIRLTDKGLDAAG